MIEKMNESYRLKLIESQFKSIIKSISDHFSEVEIITLIEKCLRKRLPLIGCLLRNINFDQIEVLLNYIQKRK